MYAYIYIYYRLSYYIISSYSKVLVDIVQQAARRRRGLVRGPVVVYIYFVHRTASATLLQIRSHSAMNSEDLL